MFELVYLHPFSDERVAVNDENKVAYSTLGVSIELTKKSSMLVPWHRVLSIVSTNEAIKTLQEYTAFGG